MLLAGTALLYLWNLSASGWGNSFYAAAAQAGAKSWKAWLFGALDAGNAITVDKPPAAMWVTGLSARLFGVHSWSILAPQALMGVAAVYLVHLTVKRWFGTGAALFAGAALALTPVAVLVFRFDNTSGSDSGPGSGSGSGPGSGPGSGSGSATGSGPGSASGTAPGTTGAPSSSSTASSPTVAPSSTGPTGSSSTATGSVSTAAGSSSTAASSSSTPAGSSSTAASSSSGPAGSSSTAAGSASGPAGSTAGGPPSGGRPGSTSNTELTSLLKSSTTRWSAAISGATSAADLELSSGTAVIALGGWNGSDPSPTLAEFQEYVTSGQIRYCISGGGMGGGGAMGGASTQSSQIATWVAAHYTAKTVGNTTIYDLTQPKSN